MNRFLESETYNLNHKHNRIVVSEFGTKGIPDPCLSLFGKFNALFIPEMDLTSDNCVVSVLQVKDQLLALTEGNVVRAVDPETLNTDPKKVCVLPEVI